MILAYKVDAITQLVLPMYLVTVSIARGICEGFRSPTGLYLNTGVVYMHGKGLLRESIHLEGAIRTFGRSYKLD